MAAINYPVWRVVDDGGTLVSGATVTIASVTDIDGAAIASHGAVVHVAGPNVCVAYDAETKGDAWITLAVSKAGSTFSGENASPAAYLTADPSKISTRLDAAVSSRSTYAGADTAGTTTLLGRVTSTRASALDNLDATVSGVAGAVAAVATTLGAAGAGLTALPRTGYKLASDGLDTIPIETGINARQALSLQLAALAGKISGASGAATQTIVIKAGNDANTTRITATCDRYGNRSTVTLAIPT